MPFARPALRFRPSLAFLLLAGLLTILWIAGGASRGDAMGQVAVRSVSWAIVVTMLLTRIPPPARWPKPVLFFLLAAIALPLVQLIPLPPGFWQMLPGRRMFTEAVTLTGQAQPWRPWSIVPGATANAAASLIVPFATLLVVTGVSEEERKWLPGAMLLVVVASTLVGLMQFSGAVFTNPFINDTLGDVSATFANRNHFALFMAIGCLLAPFWGLTSGRFDWRAPTALGLISLFLLTILASGSRAGLGLGVIALLLGLLLAREGMQRALARYPRWVFPSLIAGTLTIVMLFVLLSVMADRAASINRLFAVDQGQDMRSRGLPTVLGMIGTYFPFGTGLGSFDPIFRMHEPYALLKRTYFNHAHNDFLEIVLDAGVPGLLLLATALGWWAWASIRAWAPGSGRRYVLPRLGSAMLFLIIVASIFDYPARTPMVMAVVVIAAIWLANRPEDGSHGSPLPRRGHHL